MPTKPRGKKKIKVGLAPPEPVLAINSSDKGDCPPLEMDVKIHVLCFSGVILTTPTSGVISPLL